MSKSPENLGKCFNLYLNSVSLRSRHTEDAYRRSVQLFFDFLKSQHRVTSLPIYQHGYITPEEIPPTAFSALDTPLFLHFAEWMLAPASGKGDRRPYALATIKLRVAGVQNWFQFMYQNNWLPATFDLQKAINQVQIRLKALEAEEPDEKVEPTPMQDIQDVIVYYDTQSPPEYLRKPDASKERRDRWELTRLRNRALIHCLADTGGRISEILSLNTDAFFPNEHKAHKQLSIAVRGKGGHPYHIHLTDSLETIYDYLDSRGINSMNASADVPVFISHDKRYRGNRMSRIVAWRVVNRAAGACGLQDISPQEFRHWRAMKLIEEGHSLKKIRDMLGHRSVETIRQFYGNLLDQAQQDNGDENIQ